MCVCVVKLSERAWGGEGGGSGSGVRLKVEMGAGGQDITLIAATRIKEWGVGRERGDV